MTVARESRRKDDRLELRLEPAKRRLLDEAAAASAMSTSAFVLSHATAAAQQVLADRTTFVLPAERWDAFIELLVRDERRCPASRHFCSDPASSTRSDPIRSDRADPIEPRDSVLRLRLRGSVDLASTTRAPGASTGHAKVYVVCRHGFNDVVGYYALSAGSVASEDATERLKLGIGRYPVPVVVVARLGVDVSEQGRGLGSALVKDCFLQVASVADRVRIRALLFHAETAKAAGFYFRIDPALERSPSDPRHVLLLLKDLRRAIRDTAAKSQVIDG